MTFPAHNPIDILQRMADAPLRVRQWLSRACAVLGDSGVPYAVEGGNAVAAWVATVDPAAVRNTPRVDILLRAEDFLTAKSLLEGAGFVHRSAPGAELFLQDPNSRQGVRVVFAGTEASAGRASKSTYNSTPSES